MHDAEPTPREEPYVFLTWLARWMSGERSCEWAVWFQAHWKDFKRAEGDTSFAVWRARHTKLLRETHRALNADGYRVKVEAQNWFRYRHEGAPIVVGGKPDLLAFRDDDAIVLDVKTGRAHDWHEQQVLLPMSLLPRSDLAEYEDARFRGRLVYEDGLVRDFPARQAEDVFEQLPYFLDILAGPEEEAHRVPSREECRFCPISGAHCPERIEPAGVVPDAPAPAADPFG